VKRSSANRRRLIIESLETRRTLDSTPFALVVLPDTQFYTQTYPATFDSQTQWIVDNIASRNIAFVSHVGDIVESGETGTNQNELEWTRADASMDKLDGNLATQIDGLVPYSTALGNHDYAVVSNKNSGSTRYQQFFGPSRYEGRSWYLEDSGLPGAHAQIFEAGGYRFLHLTVQWESLDVDLAWAKGVIDRNPGLPTILTTHSYLNPGTLARQNTIQGSSGGVPNAGNTGEQVFQKFVFNNPSIFLVMNGHFTGEFTRVATNRAGQSVVEMVADYQGLQNGGDGWLRIIDFNFPMNKLDFSTYSPTRVEFQTDANSLFSIPFNFVERFGVPEDAGHAVTKFQNGRVNANAIYNGTVDTQIRQNAPTTSYGTTTSELLVDFPDAGTNNASHAMLQFTHVFGSGIGQIPLGSQIVSAKLVIDSTNPGHGAKLHRMLVPWDGSTTWNAWNSDGIQANDLEAASNHNASVGSSTLSPLVPVDSELTIDVATDVRAWASGSPNHGWAMLPWSNGTNEWGFSPSEVVSFGDRPLLEIEWIPPSGANVPPVVTSNAVLVNYTENDPPVLLFPSASLADVDSTNFEGGSVRVDIVSNSSSEDRLSVVHVGNGVGQIGVAAGVISFGGVPIGQMSEGVGAKSLSISLNAQASRDAVETVLRNIAFRSVSEAPTTAARSVRMFVRDGDGGLSNQSDTMITLTPVNDDPTIIQSTTGTSYSSVSDVVGLDTLVRFNDVDSFDLNGGIVTVQFSNNGLPGDVLGIRNQGTGAGQIGVSGNAITFQNAVIGTLVGGTAGQPLSINLNASSNVASVQALLRALVFQTSNDRLSPLQRTVSISVTDGDGGTSNTLLLTIDRSVLRRARFQEGVDHGQGVYSGARDIQLRESNPTTVYPTGQSAEGLFIDYDATAINSQVLLRFENIFGSGSGRVPLGATIVSARLVLDVNNPGDGGSFHRMLTPWDSSLDTWSSLGNSVSPRNNLGGVQTDGSEARLEYRAQGGTSSGVGDVANGVTVIGVTDDIQAWSSGVANLGWLIRAWTGYTNGWAFSPSEAAQTSDRPRLEIDWVPANIARASFQQGVDGYAGTVDTVLTQATPTSNQSANVTLFVDDNSPDPANPGQFLNDQSQALLRFDNVVGTLPNQVPAGAWIHSASVELASNTSDAPGVGGRFFAMRQPWSGLSNWATFTNGVQPDNTEAAIVPSVLAGGQPNTPRVEGGWNSWDTTKDVQTWSQNSSTNLGWAILPWLGGTDGWGIQSSETALLHERPRLRAFFTPVGITVSPVTGLTTTELGGTAQFSVSLNTPPTGEVTIPLASTNTREGVPLVSNLVFTPSNWDVPQIVTVRGVDDFIANGDTAYQIVTSPAVSLDPNYNGLNASDVSLVNTGNGLTTPIVFDRRVFYHRSTSAVFGNGSGNPINAIDPTKQALLPGQTTTVANYTNYSRGLNGIVVDIANATNLSGISAASFQFATWSTFPDSTPSFVTINPSVTVSTFAGGGLHGSDRVKLEFANNVIQNAWLRVTMLADANTGLTVNDVSYFGNARFDVTPTAPFPSQQIVINVFDVNAIRAKQGQNSGIISNIHDVDRSGVVNVFDTNAVRANQSVASLRSFTAPLSMQMGLASSTSNSTSSKVDALFADTSWLDAFQSSDNRNRLRARRL
jgi:Planctomycete extracellular